MNFKHLRRLMHIFRAISRTGILPSIRKKEPMDGEVFREQLQSLGPAFIKLGQFISTRDDLLPEQVRTELERLQDQGLEEPFIRMQRTLEEEWKCSMDKVLKQIDPQPIGIASIGQVYRGVLHSGETVAIKIQKPSVEQEILQDIRLLKALMKKLDRWSGFPPSISYSEILEDFTSSLKKELDFEEEALHIQTFAHQNRSTNVRIPRVYLHWTTRKVLVMEYIDGKKLKDSWDMTLPEKKKLAKQFAIHLFDQIFIEGFFHGDPHPGNVLTHDGELIYLDFGNMGRLYPPSRKWMSRIFFHLMNENYERLADVVCEDVFLEPMTKKRLVHDLSVFTEKYMKSPVKKVKLGNTFLDLMNLLKQYSIHVPNEMFQAGSTLIKAEGTIALLHPELTLSELIHHIGKKMIQEKYDPDTLSKGIRTNQEEMYQMLQEIPVYLHQTVKNMSTGKSPITIRLHGEKVIMRKLDRMMNLLTFGLILLSFSIISTGIILSLKLTNNTIISSDHAALLGVTSSLVVTLVFIGIVMSFMKKTKRSNH